ncbi:TOR signaling pathway regulator [Drechmeria coniospora]|uniref:TOR signaling pathway regulator n=1 Tax=Drechmeria coniospora TaxID=98403 RepID=A0A151GQS1_DRECN|nr:TOR signaling pathway regulator [Drechmeria coniospora]KYK59457.1 TOR signaling pathway regulator [Drechmeria coniospora]
MASTDEPLSLGAAFEAAEEGRRELESSPDAMRPTFADELDVVLAAYVRVLDQVAVVGLFSANETLEDVATSSLPYLLIHFHIAELVQRTPSVATSAARHRILVLGRARVAYERFLALVDAYGLILDPYDKLLERYRDDIEAFRVVPPGRDAAAQREAKIAGFRAEKALEAKLSHLRAEANARYADGGADEDIAREVHLASIRCAIHQAFHALDSLNRELPLLAQAPEPEDSSRATAAKSRTDKDDDVSWRLDNPLARGPNRGGPLLSRQGQPLQPFTLVGSRADRTKAVFRPGHNLPTMSIDEYLDEERRQGNFLEGGTEAAKPPLDEDDMDAVDRATYKARSWDDFTDDNPRGSGNTLNMG